MNRNARCYNSGKIGGLPYEEVRKKFARANNEIRNMGMIPVSPLSNGLKPSRPWLLHMAADLCIMAGCRHIFMQDDWRNSRGARIEYRTARLGSKNRIPDSPPSENEHLVSGESGIRCKQRDNP